MYLDDHYKNLDVTSLIQYFDNADPNRAANMFFTDAVGAFAHKCTYFEDEEIDSALLIKVCGQPDETILFEDFEIWTYSWFGRHGYNFYLSFTPFKIQSGLVQLFITDESDSNKINSEEIIDRYVKKRNLNLTSRITIESDE
ncbi:MAG: hypothetical protein CME32_10705 [Gimesia sp.]|uniref:hypothetical protein n=1 Tax=Gimesia chilikensis TaxID=2605989 RepID=UPI000C46ACDF|nr:hypothetical protein [Gimesia chilikensis]KAA0139122.1 hypothetical protein FYZ48_10770 [Gimesia chilikensis]MBN69732.1 hypothetical protein [Gimesia sp.]MCR9229492.1 hypothetical protein [bacterium]